MSFLRAMLFTAPLCVLTTILYGAAGIAMSFFDEAGDRQIRIARAWGRAICFICRVRVITEGMEKIDPSKHYIFTPNHLSYIDTPVLIGSLPMNFRFMAKRGLFQIPFLGSHLQRAGHIPVPREDPRASIRVLSQAARIMNERKISVLIFPEGGRSPHGKLREFKEGAAYLAIKSGTPVVPIGLVGTRNILPMHSMHVRGGDVRIRIGDPIDTTQLNLHDRGRLNERIRNEVAAMVAPTPGDRIPVNKL
jgi:1-acyl-sn-glycerol-3-phosphate acyltransferase